MQTEKLNILVLKLLDIKNLFKVYWGIDSEFWGEAHISKAPPHYWI